MPIRAPTARPRRSLCSICATDRRAWRRLTWRSSHDKDEAAAGESGHAPLKRGRSLQAIVLGGEITVRTGDQVNRVAALAMKRGKSVDFTGYWQRHIAERDTSGSA